MSIANRLDWTDAEGAPIEVLNRADRRRWIHLVRLALNAGLLGYRVSRVASALLAWQGPGGIFPSMETLAETAECSRRHVSRAIARLELLNLVRRERRTRLEAGMLVRDSNRYVLLLPPVLPRHRPRMRPLPLLSHFQDEGKELIPDSRDIGSQRSAALALPRSIIAPAAALAARRAVIEQRLAARWLPGRNLSSASG